MKTEKWTPGPWRFVPHHEVDVGTPAGMIYNAHGGSVCRVYSEVRHAHLIAAAPDLYAALRDLVAWCHAQGSDISGSVLQSLLSGERALAKARGEQP